MPIVLTVRLHGAVELVRALNSLQSTIESGVSSSIGRRLGIEGVRIARQLTPRQTQRTYRVGRTSRGKPPLYKQWELIEQVATANAYRAVIRNKATADAQGLVILAALEFGARPHVIRPRGRYPLKWRQSGTKSAFVGRGTFGMDVIEARDRGHRQAGLVRAMHVSHPGHKPFHMVADTREHLERVGNTMLVQFQQKINAIFGTLTVRVS